MLYNSHKSYIWLSKLSAVLKYVFQRWFWLEARLYIFGTWFKSEKSQIGYRSRGIQIRHQFFHQSSHWSEIRSMENWTGPKLDVSFQLRSQFWSKFEIGYRCWRIRIRHHFFNPSSHWSEMGSIKKSSAVKLDVSFQLRFQFWSKFEISYRDPGIQIRHYRYRAWGSESDWWIWVGAF